MIRKGKAAVLNDEYWYREIDKNTDIKPSTGRVLKKQCSFCFVLSMLRVVISDIVIFFVLFYINAYLNVYPLLIQPGIPVSNYRIMLMAAAIVVLLVTAADVFIHVFQYKLYCTFAETAIDKRNTKNTNQQLINALHMMEITLVETEELLEQKL